MANKEAISPEVASLFIHFGFLTGRGGIKLYLLFEVPGLTFSIFTANTIKTA